MSSRKTRKKWVSRFSYNPILVDRGRFGDRHGSAATRDSEFSCRIVSFYGILDGSVVELRRGERESSSHLPVRTRRLVRRSMPRKPRRSVLLGIAGLASILISCAGPERTGTGNKELPVRI
jgi:hypothetical protein